MSLTTEVAIEKLVAMRFLEEREGRWRTTRRFQGAMARAARRLLESSESDHDLRLPIAFALVETCGAELADDDVAAMVDAMLPIEADELAPRSA